jgi:hypothetical protein
MQWWAPLEMRMNDRRPEVKGFLDFSQKYFLAGTPAGQCAGPDLYRDHS